MGTASLDAAVSRDMSEIVYDLKSRSFLIETEINHCPEVKVEWMGRPRHRAYVLLTPEGARRLAEKLRHAVDLPIPVCFRESVFDTRDRELAVFMTSADPGVVLCSGEGGASGSFAELGRFDRDATLKLAIALEASASAIDRFACAI